MSNLFNIETSAGALLQEFLSRGWKLQWVNVTGHEVGTHARACASGSHTITIVVVFANPFRGQS